MFYIIGILMLISDQVSKYYAVELLRGREPYVLVDNFLQLNYIENFGAAFGILQNKQLFFIILTTFVIIGILIYIKLNTKLSKPMIFALVMVVFGALGNLIDRIRLGYVIDFIDVKFGNFYDFPVFNFADSFIVVATIVIMYLVLFEKNEV
jgi:signal peptidase II